MPITLGLSVVRDQPSGWHNYLLAATCLCLLLGWLLVTPWRKRPIRVPKRFFLDFMFFQFFLVSLVVLQRRFWCGGQIVQQHHFSHFQLNLQASIPWINGLCGLFCSPDFWSGIFVRGGGCTACCTGGRMEFSQKSTTLFNRWVLRPPPISLDGKCSLRSIEYLPLFLPGIGLHGFFIAVHLYLVNPGITTTATVPGKVSGGV